MDDTGGDGGVPSDGDGGDTDGGNDDSGDGDGDGSVPSDGLCFALRSSAAAFMFRANTNCLYSVYPSIICDGDGWWWQ